ncbi:MAG TPA: TRL domain-containing protein [Elusimicrobiota bacterium]|nr:TRL domain-containing protein [Elusimicrobiota bacterium]
MRTIRLLALPILTAALSSCGLLYTDVKVPRGYRSATPSDVKTAPDDPTVTGKSCSHSLLWLVAWGDTSYNSALKNALGEKDGILYDVRSDVKVNAYVLGLYTKACTILTGKVAKP